MCAGSTNANVSGSYDCATTLASVAINPIPALTGVCTWSLANLSSDPCQFVGSNIAAGNFNVSVTNNGITINFCVVINPLLLPGVANFTVVNPSCLGNDGSITFNAAGFTVLAILWSNGAFGVNTINNLVPGNYTCLALILAPNNATCASTVPFILPAYTPIAVTASAQTDFCDTDGSGPGVGNAFVASTPSGGSGSGFNWQWSGPANIDNPNFQTTNITGGIGCFDVTVSDPLYPWCTATATVQVEPPCGGDYDCNGVINVSDLLYWQSSFTQFAPTIGDLTGCDDITNVLDLLVFIQVYGTFCP
ncbi:MAG: hypothetical protein SH856_03900 [Flavobacteriales bacterium]|nr:hypothetical protein [Flavobacteriales bacterium]